MYSLSWAQDVVKRHYQAHARVSYFLLTKVPFTADSLARFVASRDPKWELWKKGVDCIEKYINTDPEPSQYYTDVGVNGFSALDEILSNLVRTPLEAIYTRLGVCIRLEKHFLKARARASREAGRETDPGTGTLDLFGGRSL